MIARQRAGAFLLRLNAPKKGAQKCNANDVHVCAYRARDGYFASVPCKHWGKTRGVGARRMFGARFIVDIGGENMPKYGAKHSGMHR